MDYSNPVIVRTTMTSSHTAFIQLSNGRRVEVHQGTVAIYENADDDQPMLIDLASEKIRPL